MDFGRLSPNSTILGDLFYNTYKDAGLSPGLAIMALLIAICTISGNCLNLFLVYLTIKHKCLRGSTNYLLALNSFYEFLHQTGHYIFLATVLSGRNFVPFLLAAFLQMQSIFGYNAAIFTMIETALDRFLGVFVPNFHATIDGPAYLIFHTLFSFIPGIYLAFLVMRYALDHPTEPVTGQLSDTCTPVNLIYNYNMVVCMITFVLYMLIGILVWKKVGHHLNPTNVRLLKSLAAICLLLVGSYFFNTIIRLIVVGRLDPVQLWYVNVAGGVLVNIGAAANAPILYMFSTEYRKLMTEELSSLLKHTTTSSSTNRVHSQQPPTAPRRLFQQSQYSQRRPFSKNVLPPIGAPSVLPGNNTGTY